MAMKDMTIGINYPPPFIPLASNGFISGWNQSYPSPTAEYEDNNPPYHIMNEQMPKSIVSSTATVSDVSTLKPQQSMRIYLFTSLLNNHLLCYLDCTSNGYRSLVEEQLLPNALTPPIEPNYYSSLFQPSIFDSLEKSNQYNSPIDTTRSTSFPPLSLSDLSTMIDK